MNELSQLKDFIPKLKEDYQYTKIANTIAEAVKHGKTSISMVLDFRLSDEAMDYLNDAHVSVEVSTDVAGEYIFKF